jgi:hypothetical protein
MLSYSIYTDLAGEYRGQLFAGKQLVLMSGPQPTADDAWLAARRLYENWPVR